MAPRSLWRPIMDFPSGHRSRSTQPTKATSVRGSRGSGPRWMNRAPAFLTGASTVAVFCWILGTCLAVAVVRMADLNPLTIRGAVLPIALAGVAGAAVLPVVVRWPSDRVIGAVAGLYAAWIALVQISALHGTPFAQRGVVNLDPVRLTALANRLSTTWGSADAFLPGVPSEYPPLYPWVVGHLADALHRPVWLMMKPAQIVVMSAAVVAAFVLWRRLVGAPAALAMAAVAPAVFTWGYKEYEILTLAVFVPYLLATFTDRSEGGLHWLPAGIIGGLFAATYVGYLLFGSAGVLALIVARLLRPDRRRYLLHLLGVLVTAAVVASWYLGPLAIAYLTRPRNQLSDTYLGPTTALYPVPIGTFVPVVFRVLMLIGLFGLAWYCGREWWAEPILLILGGVALYWGVSMLSTALTGHTFFLPKSARMVNMILIVAGVLTVSRAAAPVITRPTMRARSVSIVALGLLIMIAGLTCWEAWTPGTPRGFVSVIKHPGQLHPNPATKAHLEILPDGRTPRFAPTNLSSYPDASPMMPADKISREVERRLGPRRSADEPVGRLADLHVRALVLLYAGKRHCVEQPGAVPRAQTGASTVECDHRAEVIRRRFCAYPVRRNRRVPAPRPGRAVVVGRRDQLRTEGVPRRRLRHRRQPPLPSGAGDPSSAGELNVDERVLMQLPMILRFLHRIPGRPLAPPPRNQRATPPQPQTRQRTAAR